LAGKRKAALARRQPTRAQAAATQKRLLVAKRKKEQALQHQPEPNHQYGAAAKKKPVP
jgi:hypothetical protein